MGWTVGRNGGCVSRPGNRAYEGTNFYQENTVTAVERFCPVTRNSSIPRVNALRTAKVRAPPRVYVAALKFGLVLALELDMDRPVGEHD
jgi:hypothetical protein